MFESDDDVYQDDSQPVVKDIIEKTEFYGAGKPWLNNSKEPSGYLKPALNADWNPKIKYELSHVFGYRGKF